MTRPDLDAYLLCATPRSGSTLLCGVLDSSGVAGHPASYFHREIAEEYAEQWGITRAWSGRIDDVYVRAAVVAGRTPNGVFGARVMGERLPELVDDLRTGTARTGSDLQLLSDQFGRLRFVHLRRRDVVAQAVSWARSLQTHFWHPGEAVAPGGQEPHYDADLIGELVSRIEAAEAFWADWFARYAIAPHEVTYEELSADPVRAAHAVLGHLGLHLPSERRLAVRHRKQADELNTDWIARFRAL